MSHITGGGLAANLSRVLPAGITATVDRSTWTPQPIFDLVATVGSLSRDDLEATLNLGVGMIAVVAPEAADTALTTLADRGVRAWVCGEVAESAGQAGSTRLVGEYAH
jgi:phosphoribosylformylglycinamidine cyclo-ligase